MAEDAVPATDPLAAWTAVLDDIEASIALAFTGEDPQWAVPAVDPGPLPAELQDRALRLLDASREAEMMLAEQRVTVSRHLGAVTAIPVETAARPGRLDISA